MQFFVHGVDNPDVAGLLDALAEQHWAYMDRYAEHLVARGPTLSADGTAHTGSVHVLEAPTVDGARRFATQEPFHLAGLYASMTVTRFENALAGPCGIGRRPGRATSAHWCWSPGLRHLIRRPRPEARGLLRSSPRRRRSSSEGS